MTEHEGQSGSDGAPPVTAASDETLRLYLLCRLAEGERLNLDERLLLDDKLAERITLIESELADDYAAGRLNPIEQEAFAQRFLVTEDRRRQLRFTLSLQDYSRSRATAPVSVITPRPKLSWSEKFAELLSPHRPAWAVAGSIAVLILLVGLVWLIARQRRDSTPLIAKHDSLTPAFSPAPPQGSVPRTAVSPTPQPAPPRNPDVAATPAESPATIATFVLLPGVARSGGELKRVAVPAGKRDLVRLNLTVEETTATADCQAELATAEGQTVVGSSKPRISPGNRVVLDVPARLLHSGDYQIKLTQRNAGGQSETVGRYYFRALKN